VLWKARSNEQSLHTHANAQAASVFLEKSLFTTYNFHAPTPQREIQDSDSEDDNPELNTAPNFQISLPALLETLQIFGLTDINTTKPPWARDNAYSSTAFSNNVLGMNNLCRISYDGPGAPLSVILTEASIRTTCDLTTYEPEYAEEIPFDRHSLALKIVMRGARLSNAISELATTSPENLNMIAKMVRGKPFFALSSTGTLSSANVKFNNDPRPPTMPTPAPTNPNAGASIEPPTDLLETFILSDPDAVLRSSYKFGLIQKAARAMSVSTKVSLRADTQGVLNLQFMVEVDAAGGAPGGNPSFVDFRFVPLAEGEEEDAGAGDGDETLLMNGDGSDGDGDEDML